MQAISPNPGNCPYNGGMPGGRPSKRKRSDFGERVVALRQRAGLSQTQVAEKLGVSQQAYAGWERSTGALRPDDLAKLAAIFSVPTDELLGTRPPAKRGTGPIGKAKAIFERVSALPRDRQQKILGAVEDMLVAHESRKAS
ncbi:MAG: helix-turn-helix domain-containing protein [Opitutaceae bacterium]